MPWKESSVKDERLKFVALLLEGESMAEACRLFGISRKTGYKFWNRYKEGGYECLIDQPRVPNINKIKTHSVIEEAIVNLRKEKPHWGAAKIREIYKRKYPEFEVPAVSTFHAIFTRNDLIKKRFRKRKPHSKATGTFLSIPQSPNDLWCADYKGEFKLGDSSYCYPLTVTDSFSRYIIGCEALKNVKSAGAIEAFDRIFQEYGIPKRIKTDNGTPFGFSGSLYTLSPLSVWWLSLGIKVERTRPGHPEENGQHERMHRVLKAETTKPPKNNQLQQQERFDDFKEEYNRERPHQALELEVPSKIYEKSEVKYKPGIELSYPGSDLTKAISSCGRIKWKRKQLFISKAFGRHNVGLTEVDDGIWNVHFKEYLIGCFSEDDWKFIPIESPLNGHV